MHAAAATDGLLPGAMAIQVSGHLRRTCDFRDVEEQVLSCRARFTRCDVFVHTWTELEPRTPHWRRGWPKRPKYNTSSASCVQRLNRTLRPLALVVEQQGDPPPEGSLGPDGKPFAETGVLNWGAARHFGWRMSVHAMNRANELRRSSARAYTFVLRLRPDGGRGACRRRLCRLPLWDCLSLHSTPSPLPTPAAPSSRPLRVPVQHPNGDVRVERLGAPGVEAHNWSRHLVAQALNSCSGFLMSQFNSDNCFFATPTSVDKLFAQLEGNYVKSFKLMTRRGLQHSRPERQLWTAAIMAGLPLATPCAPR